ncbi:hypothetical protein [uncultured Methanolobus sp.]|uniref:hypothetical protein n=1 Tax=uncultured Methanolobus sp. TaxID=218300 RepID=UPI003747CC42
MGNMKSALWEFIFELYGVQIAIYIVLAFAFVLQIMAWILGFIPLEYQSNAFLLLSCIAGIVMAVVLYLITKIPSFAISFFRSTLDRLQ